MSFRQKREQEVCLPLLGLLAGTLYHGQMSSFCSKQSAYAQCEIKKCGEENLMPTVRCRGGSMMLRACFSSKGSFFFSIPDQK